ncbi:MAG: single-stranded DNA-binding protein [Prevotella sp.]|nr:single-stranded DNA-binding protein [Candidatus Prevotella equi]
MNKFIAMGRLTKDPEVRYSQGATPTAVANFSIAVDRRFKREGEPDADFFNCTAFGKQGEFVEKYLKKGIKVVVCGRVQNETYTNKEGQKVTQTKVMVEEIEFAESKNAGEQKTEQKPMTGNDGFMSIPDGIAEELPFN